MLNFNFFDSNAWEVVSNEAMKDKINALEKEIFMNYSDYISELEDKVKYLESRNKDLIKLCDEEYDKNKSLEAANEKLSVQNRVCDSVISLRSELNTKIDNQSKEITRLLKNQEKLKAEIVDKEQIISSLEAKCNILSKKVRELNEGIHNSDDRSWKDKYEALKISSDQAIAALQKRCINTLHGVKNIEHNYTEEVRMKESFKYDNYILREKVKEISDLAETIIELCEDEE